MQIARCAHCKRPAIGFGIVATGEVVCHTGMLPPDAEPPDCYRLVTIYGHAADGSCCAARLTDHQPVETQPCG